MTDIQSRCCHGIVNMGVKDADGKVCYVIGITKAIRKKIGKNFGDTVAVTICERI